MPDVKKLNSFFLSFFFLSLVACGGGGGGSDDPAPPPTPENIAPKADAGDDQTVDEQTQVNLSGTGTDSDGTIASYSWSQVDGESVTLSDSGEASASFDAPITTSQLTLNFRLTVTDDDGATDTDDITIQINPVNAAPVINLDAEKSVNERDIVELTAEANDNDGSITTIIWTQTQGESIELIDSDTLIANFTAPDVEQDTIYSWELSVTDNEGETSKSTINVTVNPFYPTLDTKSITLSASAFTNADIDTSNFDVSAFDSEVKLVPSTNPILELSDANEGQLIFVSDESDNLITVAFVNTVAYESGEFDISANTIADGMILSVPRLHGIERETRFEILEAAQEHEKYELLVESVESGIENNLNSFIDPELTLSVWQPAFEIVNEVLEVVERQSKLQKIKSVDLDLPHILDSENVDDIEIVNPTMIFYNYIFGNDVNDYLIAGKDQAWKFSFTSGISITEPSKELFGHGLGQSNVRFDAGSNKASVGNLVRGFCIALDMALFCPITSKQIENFIEGNILSFDNLPDFKSANSYKEILSGVISYFDPQEHPERLDKFIKFAFKGVKGGYKKYIGLIKKLNAIAYTANLLIDGTQSAIPFLWDLFTKPTVIDCVINNEASAFSFTCDNQPPVAMIERSPKGYVAVNQAVTYTTEGTSDDNDSIEELETRWDFDNDGNFESNWSTNNKVIEHTYTSEGVYEVKLEVRDSEGEVSTAISEVVVSSTGLIAHYPFNGNANDESSNGLNGVVDGAVLTSDRNGNSNSAYFFDGINDEITIDSELFSSEVFTVSAWVKTNQLNKWSAIVAYGESFDTDSMQYSLFIDDNNQYLSWFEDRGDNSNDENYAYSTTQANLNEWNFVVALRDTSGNFRIYINGILESTETNTLPPVRINHFLSIGFRTNSGNIRQDYFNGSIDDVRVYNRALSQEEITALYND